MTQREIEISTDNPIEELADFLADGIRQHDNGGETVKVTLTVEPVPGD